MRVKCWRAASNCTKHLVGKRDLVEGDDVWKGLVRLGEESDRLKNLFRPTHDTDRRVDALHPTLAVWCAVQRSVNTGAARLDAELEDYRRFAAPVWVSLSHCSRRLIFIKTYALERVAVRCIASLGPPYRSSFRIISFSPDQTSSTAQTFISTSPSGKAIWRTTSSVTSVATPEPFFGQDTHIIPAGSIAHRNDSSLAFSVDLDDANKCMKATPLLTRVCPLHRELCR